MRSMLLVLAVTTLVGPVIAAQDGANDDPIATRLRESKETYSASVEEAREDLIAAFDRKLSQIKANKRLKVVDQIAQLKRIEMERQSFEEENVLPASQTMRSAVSNYAAGIRKATRECQEDYKKAATSYRNRGDLESAAAVLEDAEEFLDPGALGLRVRRQVLYLSQLQPVFANKINAQAFKSNGEAFGGLGQIEIQGQRSPHGLGLHPPNHGFSGVSYVIAPRWKTLRGAVAIDRNPVMERYPGDPLTFEILGNGRVLWTSEPVRDYESPKSFSVEINGIVRLQLRVHCAGNNNNAWAVWLEPRLER